MIDSSVVGLPLGATSLVAHPMDADITTLSLELYRACSGSTYIKIGTIQRRLAWPLRKDDTQIREAFQIFRPCPKHPYTFWNQRQRKLVCFGKFSRAVNQNPPIWLVVWFVLENLPELSIKMLQSDWSFGLSWKITQFWSIIRFPYSKLTREDNNSYFLYESVAMKIAVL